MKLNKNNKAKHRSAQWNEENNSCIIKCTQSIIDEIKPEEISTNKIATFNKFSKK